MSHCSRLSIIILTHNEELNLPLAIDSVQGWTQAIYVVDSFSDDATVAIAEASGVPVYQNKFTHWAAQRNWALTTLPIETPWVMFLDADERVTADLRNEITATLAADPGTLSGFYCNRHTYFLGQYLKHGGMSPNPILRIVRPEKAALVAAGDREYFRVDGEVGHLDGYLHHEDERDLAFWISKHNRISAMAVHYRNQQSDDLTKESGELEGRRRIWVRQKLIGRLPFWFQPITYFCYRYLFRLGFLDGKAGLIYYVLHEFWYPFLIEAKQYEWEQQQASSASLTPLADDREHDAESVA